MLKVRRWHWVEEEVGDNKKKRVNMCIIYYIVPSVSHLFEKCCYIGY